MMMAGSAPVGVLPGYPTLFVEGSVKWGAKERHEGRDVLGREQLWKVVGGRGRRVVVDGGRPDPRGCVDVDRVRPAASRALAERVAAWSEERELDGETRSDAPRKRREERLQSVSRRATRTAVSDRL